MKTPKNKFGNNNQINNDPNKPSNSNRNVVALMPHVKIGLV